MAPIHVSFGPGRYDSVRSLTGAHQIIRLLPFALAPLLTGCGVQFLYNNFDTLITSQLEDYVELTPEQQAYFESEFEALWQWHRAEELPRYATDLENWAGLVDDGVTDSEVDQVFDSMQGWWQRVEARGKPATKAFIKRLNDSQIYEIAQAFQDENAKWDKRYKDRSLELRQRRWAKNFERLLERFTGSLGRQQQGILAVASQDYQPVREYWREYRLLWQQAFLTLLESRHDAAPFEAQFDLVFGAQQRLYSDELIEAQVQNETLTRRIVLAVLQSLDESQVEKFKNTLAARAQEFRELSREG